MSLLKIDIGELGGFVGMKRNSPISVLLSAGRGGRQGRGGHSEDGSLGAWNEISEAGAAASFNKGRGSSHKGISLR